MPQTAAALRAEDCMATPAYDFHGEQPLEALANLDLPSFVRSRLKTSTASSLAGVVSALADGPIAIVKLYDALVGRSDREGRPGDRRDRQARRFLDGHQLRELSEELRRRVQVPRRGGRALLLTAAHGPSQSMAAHVLELSGYEVAFVGVGELMVAPELAAVWGQVSFIGLDENLLVSATTRPAALKSVIALRNLLGSDKIFLLADPFQNLPGSGLSYDLTVLATFADLAAIVGAVAPNPLAKREVEVLNLVAQGRSNDAIARELQLSIGTVKTYLERVHLKLGTVDRASAIALCLRRGWLI